MSLPPLPPLIPSNFRWHSSPDDPGTTQRLANGTEAWVGIKSANAKGQYNNYLNTTLRIGNVHSVSLASLKQHFALALPHIRFQHPELACTAVWGETGPPYIQYVPLRHHADALDWAHQAIETRASVQSGIQLRTQLEKQRREAEPKPSKSFSIFLAADVANEKTLLAPGEAVDMLIYFNHIYWDGISERMFVGDLLQRVGEIWDLDEQQLVRHDWGDEVKNLSEPLLDACKINVEALGDKFNQARDEFINSLLRSGSSWGLTVQDEAGTPRTEWNTISKEENKAIINAIKTRLGPQYTITHLGHAATVLALLKAKPLPPDASDDVMLITPLPVNGRRFLREEYAARQYGTCQAPAVVEFPNLKSWVVDEDDAEAVRTTLAEGCKHIKKHYDYWINMEFGLAMGVSKDNFLSQFLSSNPPSFTGSSIPVRTLFLLAPLLHTNAVIEQILGSDGIADHYVPHKVVSKSGQELITVENCVSILDTYDDNILIRMEGFRGATTFSLCFNDGHFSSEDAANFLKYIVNFMLMFAQ